MYAIREANGDMWLCETASKSSTVHAVMSRLTIAPSSLPGRKPDAVMYVLPIVLIFSMPLNFGLRRSCNWIPIDRLFRTRKTPHYCQTSDVTYSLHLILARSYLIEIANDFVQQSQTFQSLLVHISFVVEFFVIWYWCEHNSDTWVTLVI